MIDGNDRTLGKKIHTCSQLKTGCGRSRHNRSNVCSRDFLIFVANDNQIGN